GRVLVVQGNCILALSGLAVRPAKYESNLPSDVEGSLQAPPECIPTTAWLSMAMDTLLCIISSGYKARGQVFPWFLHVLATLEARLPGGPGADDSQAVQFHSGLALGMVLACLHRQHL
ncbi:hypothetical protein CRUP_029611, partial [Coryphaenoides rupestris]